MTKGEQKMLEGLRALGLTPDVPRAEFVAFAWEVEIGPLVGEDIELGFKVPPDFALSAPGGVLVRPHLLPFNSSAGEHPLHGVHPANTVGVNDDTWQYWSRPHPTWAATDRSVKALLAHVRHLFDTLPADLRLPNAA
jgi:hypothetical protein